MKKPYLPLSVRQADRRGGGQRKTRHFGLHLTLDGYFCSARALDNIGLVTQVLTDLPARMRMKRLMPPYVVRAGPNRKKDPGGWSGFVMIQESHISVHTFPARRFVSIDVYSCKDFKVAPVIRYFRRAFGIRTVEKNVVVRGKEYPVANLA